jgi:hypothetical protein
MDIARLTICLDDLLPCFEELESDTTPKHRLRHPQTALMEPSKSLKPSLKLSRAWSSSLF